jgi:hypothetical protein
LLLAHEHVRDLRRAAAPNTRRDVGEAPVAQVTLRRASAADVRALHRLAELDSAETPSGSVLVAEVDGRLRAALPLDGARPIADPFYRGLELIELLRMRAGQLRRA